LCASAADLKAQHRISLADAFIAASAQRLGAVLVHKDPELAALGNLVQQELLPFKGEPAPAS
jgi:ribonuclease VapC